MTRTPSLSTTSSPSAGAVSEGRTRSPSSRRNHLHPQTGALGGLGGDQGPKLVLGLWRERDHLRPLHPGVGKHTECGKGSGRKQARSPVTTCRRPGVAEARGSAGGARRARRSGWWPTPTTSPRRACCARSRPPAGGARGRRAGRPERSHGGRLPAGRGLSGKERPTRSSGLCSCPPPPPGSRRPGSARCAEPARAHQRRGGTRAAGRHQRLHRVGGRVGSRAGDPSVSPQPPSGRWVRSMASRARTIAAASGISPPARRARIPQAVVDASMPIAPPGRWAVSSSRTRSRPPTSRGSRARRAEGDGRALDVAHRVADVAQQRAPQGDGLAAPPHRRGGHGEGRPGGHGGVGARGPGEAAGARVLLGREIVEGPPERPGKGGGHRRAQDAEATAGQPRPSDGAVIEVAVTSRGGLPSPDGRDNHPKGGVGPVGRSRTARCC